MRKLTLLFSFAVIGLMASAQTNLLTNPSFETVESGVPTPWYVVSTSVTGSVAAQDATIVKDGSNSFKIDASGASGTVNWSQVVPITGGKTYTLEMSYYIASGDGTDARIWCNFKNATAFFAEADLVATGLYPKLRGPGAENSSSSNYFADVKGSWQTYTAEFTAPATAESFDFQFRTYRTAVVYWDKMSLSEKVTAVNEIKADKLEVQVIGKELMIKNIEEGSVVEIYSAAGSKMQSSLISNGKVGIENLTNGIYIVRSNKLTQKIKL